MEGIEKKMILDVGCGHIPRGDVNCDLMIPDADEKWDLNPHWIPNFVRADVRFLPFKSRCFDVVFCSHVLEHLEDPGEGLDELKRVSGNIVAVIVPFSLKRILDPFYHRRNYGSWLRWEKTHHKHHFWMDPFKTGSFKLLFRSFFGIPIPVPFETLTVFEVDQ